MVEVECFLFVVVVDVVVVVGVVIGVAVDFVIDVRVPDDCRRGW